MKTWEVQGRNSTHAVDEFRDGKAVRTIVTGVSLKVAELIAGACTNAYRDGRKENTDQLAAADILLMLDVLEVALQTDGFMDKRVEAEARPLLEALYAKLRSKADDRS